MQWTGSGFKWAWRQPKRDEFCQSLGRQDVYWWQIFHAHQQPESTNLSIINIPSHSTHTLSLSL